MELPDDKSTYPEIFYLYIKQILENLFDFPYLNRHPLAKIIELPYLRPSETDGQRLRRLFLTAIKDLKLDDDALGRSVRWRFHRLLTLRYSEANTMQETARELGISERQAYRDMKRAEESLAQLLWERLSLDSADIAETPSSLNSNTMPEESMDSIALQHSAIPAQELVNHAIRAVERLAEQKRIIITSNMPEEPISIYTDPSLAQQILIGLFSSIIQYTGTNHVHLDLHSTEATVSFQFRIERSNSPEVFDPASQVIIQLINRLGWIMIRQSQESAIQQLITVEVKKNSALVLAIDDNAALIELLRRYLTNTHCEVVGVNNGTEGLHAARLLHPDVILLDVMMPGTDGWETLQRLKADRDTEDIPVVICSIFNDPALSASLGATKILPKPLKREDLIALLLELELI